MVYIITGPIDSGKTTKMQTHYRQSVHAGMDGVVSRKLFRGDRFVGYELERLSCGERTPLAYLGSLYAGEFSVSFPYGPFVFSQAAFDFGKKVIASLLADDGMKDIYIDEIGPIELKEGGFCSILQKVLQTDKTLYVCIRSECLPEVIDRFGISEYRILSV